MERAGHEGHLNLVIGVFLDLGFGIWSFHGELRNCQTAKFEVLHPLLPHSPHLSLLAQNPCFRSTYYGQIARTLEQQDPIMSLDGLGL